MKKFTLLLLAISLCFTACKKADDPLDEVDLTSSKDNNEMDKIFSGLNNIVQDAIETEGSGNRVNKTFDKCWSEIKLSPTKDTLTVSFDGTVCLKDGQKRTGQLIIAFTGPYNTKGTVITSTLENFTIDGKPLEGKKVVENLGRVEGTNLSFKVTVSDAKLTYEDGSTITWESERTRTWTEGENTPLNIWDDTYEITGTATGVNKNDLSYSMEIPTTSPLVIDIECWATTRLPKSGVIYIRPTDLLERSVDYGDGTCDRAITVSIGNQSYKLTI